MTWTAIVPIKPPDARKTRLEGFDPAHRRELTERLLDHVLSTLRGHADVGEVLVLSHQAREGFRWVEDHGRGLNEELEAARTALAADVLIVHADLPVVSGADISELLGVAARLGGALAPDRHRTGTNALALRRDLPFALHFGRDSCALHAAQLPAGAMVERPGLALDIDTPDDLLMLEARSRR